MDEWRHLRCKPKHACLHLQPRWLCQRVQFDRCHAHFATELQRHTLRLDQSSGSSSRAIRRNGIVLMRTIHRRNTGFSLIEVLVTLVVVAIGLLGLAKMQAAAISNTQVSRVRSLIALQTESLASAMHGNRTYWAAGVAPATFSATGTTTTDSTGVLQATTHC